MNKIQRHFYWPLLVILIAMTACSNDAVQESGTTGVPDFISATPPPFAVEPETSAPVAPPTSPPPSPTPQLAALVNGQPILLEEFEKELARYELAQAELGIEAKDNEVDYHQIVLAALVERELLRQAALVYGINITPDIVDSKLDELRASASEHGDFDAWLAANQWTSDEFHEALSTEMMVEEVVATVTADVPYAAEQIRARYIQLDDANQAADVLAQIQEGGDFSTLAQQYSRDQATGSYGGDLGYFARGSLLVPEVEAVAFSLQQNEVSEVIAVTDAESGQATYYIVQLTDRDTNRPLSTNLRYKLLQEAFDSWLAELQASATVIYFDEGQ